MKQLSAENFYLDFRQAMKEDNLHGGKTYLSLYKLLNDTNTDAFTEFINKTIIPGIMKPYVDDISHEYFRIDSVGWVNHKAHIANQSKAVGLNPHLWDLLIAAEHENNPKDWNDEVIKLAHIRCPLKVVIGYNACDDRDVGDFKKLSFVADCLQQLQCFHADQGEEFLIILGNCKGSKGYDYHRFDYRGYVYDHERNSFQRIELI